MGLAAAFLAIIVAIERAPVANAMFLLATAPFLAAGLVGALGFATFIVALRRGHLSDMLPLSVIGGTIGLAIAATVCTMTGVGLVISVHDLLWSLAMGVFQLGLALILFTIGSRSVPAADLSLLAMTEVVLAPLWVWLVFGETAGVFTLIGGALLLTAVALDALTGIRNRGLPGGE